MTTTPTVTTPTITADPRLVEPNEGDHDLFSHYVRKADLERAIFDGIPIIALCGKLWLPTRDAAKFPVCPECKEKFDALEQD